MRSTHSILVSGNDEIVRRSLIRDYQLLRSVAELAATVLASAVATVHLSEDVPEENLGGDHPGLDDLSPRIRTSHPNFGASDNLTREQP